MVVAAFVGVGVIALGTLGCLGVVTYHLVTAPRGSSNELEVPGRMLELESRVRGLELEVSKLPSLWEHERALAEEAKELATKQHRRAAQQRRAAERAAGGDPDDEDEARELERVAQLRLLDAQPGGGEGLHALPGGMARDPFEDVRERARAAGVSAFI